MKVNQVVLMLENIALESKIRVIGNQPSFEYENGARTDRQIGVTYDCVAEKNGFEKIRVSTSDSVPVITNEQLAESNEPVYVTFSTDFVGKFYWSNRTNAFELSCKAKSATLVKPQQQSKSAVPTQA